MMGHTHALGGAAALAAFMIITGDPLPAFAFAVAAGSALMPDADNHGGTMTNRPYLLPFKIFALPLWYKAVHRGRTHSLLAIAAYVGIVAFWLWGAGEIGNQIHHPIILPFMPILLAAGLGYASHIALDLFNVLPLRLFYPFPFEVDLPIPRAHKFIPGRFNAASRWSWVLTIGLTVFLCWFAVTYATKIAGATVTDHTIDDVITLLLNIISWILTSLVGALGLLGHGH